jgi:trimeric autotransporter adhesin
VSNRRKIFGLTLSFLLLVPTLSFALIPQEDSAEDLAILQSQIFSRVFITPELDVHPSLETVRSLNGAGIRQTTALSRFFAENSNLWEVRWDSRSDRVNLIQGVGVPVLPGRGNNLTQLRAGLASDGPVRVTDVERILRGFMNQYPELFRVSQEELRLNPKSTVNVGENHELWFVEFQQIRNGVPIEGANVYFRINNGNIIQFGTERVAEVNIATTPKVTREAAFAAVLDAIRSNLSEVSEIVNTGQLKIVPMLTSGERPGELYKGAAGSGYRHALVWEVSFRRTEDPATYQAWVNARNGKVLQLMDANYYAQVTGGIYPHTNTDIEVIRGFPLCNVTNGTTTVTDSAGNYTYEGGTATVTLEGRYIRINDACGTISKSNSSTGNIAFGTSSGTNCTTPGSGGGGNTHAARSAYYHLTNFMSKAASYYPDNTWVSSVVTVKTNNNSGICKPSWNGSTADFPRSGGGCSNSGELQGVCAHELGHGMDQNTGGAASDQGSGEAAGDTFAYLETKDPCIGPNFKPGVNCYNCGSCTGVRDVDDFSLGGSATIAKPSNVASNTGINCDRYACPYTSGLTAPQGPMGYEGHCESYIASSANWDLTQTLIAYWGSTTGWSKMEQIWYKSLTPSKSAYQLVSGGKCNPSASVDGCGSTNWYTVFLSVDDDDGNLTNGTPNGCRIWDAFNVHGIACGTRPACTQ